MKITRLWCSSASVDSYLQDCLCPASLHWCVIMKGSFKVYQSVTKPQSLTKPLDGSKLNQNLFLLPVSLGSGLQAGSVAGCWSAAGRVARRSHWPARWVQSSRGGCCSGRWCVGIHRGQPGPKTPQNPSGSKDETTDGATTSGGGIKQLTEVSLRTCAAGQRLRRGYWLTSAGGHVAPGRPNTTIV